MDEVEFKPITWTASEFIAHDKSGGWYAILTLGSIVLAALLWFLTKDWVTPAVVLFAAFIFGVYAKRKPRELVYTLDDHGLIIGDKHYPYDQFRSFAVVPEGGVAGIVFMPLKRFGAPLTIYYDPADENKIVDLLAIVLPLEHRTQDPIDRLMWRIRF